MRSGRRAEAALDRVLATRKEGEKLAMVLDIDETSLTNYCEMKREDYGFISVPMSMSGWCRLRRQIWRYRVRCGCTTRRGRRGWRCSSLPGRPEEQTTGYGAVIWTHAGYKGWKGLALRTGPQKTMATIEYKSEERQKIVADGYRIVMSVGDQWSDLDGTAKAEVSVKLPNPFYYLAVTVGVKRWRLSSGFGYRAW